ncbi:MAG: cell surface protein SprA [Fibrobacter sp.]|nr:cell surface protein SprA [Fibrobacter sp.]
MTGSAKRYFIFFLFFSAAFGLTNAYGQGLCFEQPRIEGFHPLDEETYASSQLVQKNPVMLKLNTTIFKDTSAIDFEKRQITFSRRDSLGYTIWEYHYPELSDYLASRKNFILFQGWYNTRAVSKKQEEKSKSQLMKLQWEIPVQYPSWAQRVLGNEPPRLSIDGNLSITMGFDRSTVVESEYDKDRATSNGLVFDVIYNFSIIGSVGRLININIRGDNQNDVSLSDNLKNFKIEYKESKPGELEDEIIQEVIAGYTGFQMPGQGLAGYSENHEGLFGIKVKSKLGPLTLTTIASHEQGETAKLSVSSKSGSDEYPLAEDRFLENRFFFLDNIYRAAYNRKYGKGASNPKDPPEVTRLDVWRRVEPEREQEILKQANRKVQLATTDSIMQTYKYELLITDRHYKLNKKEGWIMFFDSTGIRANDHIAIYLRTKDSGINRGDSIDTLLNLWTLKPVASIDSAGADPERFYLMWRNVYELTASDMTSFSLKVFRIPPDGQVKEEAGKEGNYSDILGLTENGSVLYKRQEIFDKENGVIIIPPFDTSFSGNEPFNNKKLGEYRDSVIYRYSTSTRPDAYKPGFEIVMSGSKKQTSFDLGWGVMEGTERVIADGRELKKDRDYSINYEMGTLELTSPNARTAEKVDIEYQREALFVPDRKVFLGAHGELRLPLLSDKSFIGASVLFQNTRINEDVPRLEQEPYRKVLFDVNTRIDLEPEWMTDLVNRLPLVKTDALSSVQFDFEVAHSRMNPNTENEAFVDDFEDSKQPLSLGGSHESWSKASPPYGADSLYNYPPAWDFYWFTPHLTDKKHRVRSDSIWFDKAKASAGDQQYETVIRLHATPAPDTSDDDVVRRFSRSWAGIMTYISSGFMNKEKDRYFEFLIKQAGGYREKGKLIIQMGDLREDVSLDGGPPNKMADMEDTRPIWTDQVVDTLDLGWDRKINKDEYYLIPGPSGGWDTLYYDSLNFKDPARDDYKEYYDHPENFRYACGTEKDNELSSEDINFDGSVQTHTTERYFQFTIDLTDTAAPYFDKTAKLDPNGGWKKVRIPLKEVLAGYGNMRDSINNPKWSEIKFVRLIWTDFDSSSVKGLKTEKQLIFTDMQFVGNQWQPLYDSIGTKIEATSINNQEDADYRASVRGNPFHWERDDVTGLYDRESALRINFRNLDENQTALITRNFSYQKLNLSSYKTLNLMVYGKSPSGSKTENSVLYGGKVDFVLRFGSDDSCYYEYRSDLKSGWNKVEIDLRLIADLKDRYMIEHPDSAILVQQSPYGNGFLSVKAPRGRQPNISNIFWMGIGVTREDNTSAEDSLSSGELWVNDMKVEGIGRLNGWAMSTKLNTKWADLLEISADLNYEDGDFRRMTENTLTPEISSLNGNFSSTVWFDKFLPSEWGVSLPVGGSVYGSISRPQLKNNTDVFLTENGRSDNLRDMASDLGNKIFRRDENSDITKAEHYETRNTRERVYANYSKNTESENPLVNLTADRIDAQFEYSQSNEQALQGPAVNSDSDYVRSTISESYTGKLKYNLTPTNPPEWTKWKPLGEKTPSWVPKPLKNYEFSLLPSRIEFDIADLRYGTDYMKDTRLSTSSTIRTFDLRHGFALDYSPIAPLIDLTYTIGINRDMFKDAKTDTTSENYDYHFGFHEDSVFSKRMLLWGEKNRSQHASMKLNPQIFDWLSTSGEYSADYNSDMVTRSNDSLEYITAGVRTNLSVNASFNLDVLLKELADATAKARIGSIFEKLDKGVDGIGFRQITFSYTNGADLKNNYMGSLLIGKESRIDFLRYQLGLSGIDEKSFFSGEMNNRALGGMYSRYDIDKSELYENDYRTVDQRWSLSSGLDLKVPFEISFSPISFSWGKNYRVVPDTSKKERSHTLPEFSVGSRTPALMKIELVSSALQSLNLNSTFNYRKSYKYSGLMGSDTTRKFDWAPLVSLSGTVKKWPINFNYNCTYSKEVTKAPTEKPDSIATPRDATSQGHTLDITYQIEQNSRLSEIRLLTWVIPVTGRTTVGFKWAYSTREEYTTEVKTVDEMNLSIMPHLSYIFTDNVTGRAEYIYGKRRTSGSQTTYDNKFSLIVDIQF